MKRRLGKIVAGLIVLLIGLGSALYLYGAVLLGHYVRTLLIEAGVPDDNLQVELGFAGTARLSMGPEDAPYLLVKASAPELLKLKDRQPVALTLTQLHADLDKLRRLVSGKATPLMAAPVAEEIPEAASPVPHLISMLEKKVHPDFWRYIRQIEVQDVQLVAPDYGVMLTGQALVTQGKQFDLEYIVTGKLSGVILNATLRQAEIKVQGGSPIPTLSVKGDIDLPSSNLADGLTIQTVSGSIASGSTAGYLMLKGQASIGPKSSPVRYNVSIDYDHEAERLTKIEGIYNLMGGTVLTHTKLDIPYSDVIAGKAWPLTRSIGGQATVKKVDLAQLLANFAPEGLSGTGRVSGEVPYRFDPPFTLVLAQGNLHTIDEGGVIQYRPANKPSFLAEGGQAAFLGQLFDDFHYSSLTVGLNGTVGDTLTLQTKLAGSNPAFYNGRSVAFTLNLSGALLEVLKSGGKGFKLSAGDVAAAMEKGKTAP
jgi:hypothetical protein